MILWKITKSEYRFLKVLTLSPGVLLPVKPCWWKKDDQLYISKADTETRQAALEQCDRATAAYFNEVERKHRIDWWTAVAKTHRIPLYEEDIIALASEWGIKMADRLPECQEFPLCGLVEVPHTDSLESLEANWLPMIAKEV